MAATPPEEILRILRTAASGSHDPRLSDILSDFRRSWLTIARRRHPTLRDEFDDAVQDALIDLCSPHSLDALRNVAHLRAWARALFANKLLTLARSRGREQKRRVDEPNDPLLDRIPCGAPTPEDRAAERERLAIVDHCLTGLEMARAKFLHDLPDEEVRIRFGKSPDAVRSYFRRVRRTLRIHLAET